LAETRNAPAKPRLYPHKTSDISDLVTRANLGRSADSLLPIKWNPINPIGVLKVLTSSKPARKELGQAIPYAGLELLLSSV